jgi:hypothetical protein
VRPIASYQKVQTLFGTVLRNRSFQSKDPKLKAIRYLNVGCGPFPQPHFVNLDYRWRPGVNIVWDLRKKLPFPSERFDGIFSEHCLEHFDWQSLIAVLKEFQRVLSQGGVLRVIVPSLEKYVAAYQRLRAGEQLSAEQANILGDAKQFARVFYSGHDWVRRSGWVNDGHQFIHDYESFSEAAQLAGFARTARCDLMQGALGDLLIDRPERAVESLYIEAYK